MAAPFVISPDLFGFLLTGLLCALSKREERLQKVLQARERVEQLEEEKKKRLEQKLAQHEEKNEKVNEVRQLLGKMVYSIDIVSSCKILLALYLLLKPDEIVKIMLLSSQLRTTLSLYTILLFILDFSGSCKENTTFNFYFFF